ELIRVAAAASAAGARAAVTAGRAARTGRRARAVRVRGRLSGARHRPGEAGAAEAVGDAVPGHLTGAVLGEGVERLAAEGDLTTAIGLDHAELGLHGLIARGGLPARRRLQRHPDRGALSGARDVHAAVAVVRIERLTAGVDQHGADAGYGLGRDRLARDALR